MYVHIYFYLFIYLFIYHNIISLHCALRVIQEIIQCQNWKGNSLKVKTKPLILIIAQKLHSVINHSLSTYWVL